MSAGGPRRPESRAEAQRVWMTLAIIPTLGGIVALVFAIVVRSTSWWALVGVLLFTATFNWSRVATERRRLRRSRNGQSDVR